VRAPAATDVVVDSTAAAIGAIDYHRRYLTVADANPGLQQQTAQRIAALEAGAPR